MTGEYVEARPYAHSLAAYLYLLIKLVFFYRPLLFPLCLPRSCPPLHPHQRLFSESVCGMMATTNIDLNAHIHSTTSLSKSAGETDPEKCVSPNVEVHDASSSLNAARLERQGIHVPTKGFLAKIWYGLYP